MTGPQVSLSDEGFIPDGLQLPTPTHRSTVLKFHLPSFDCVLSDFIIYFHKHIGAHHIIWLLKF